MQPVGFYSNLGSQGGGFGINGSPTLKAATSNNLAAVATAMQVRRLTPVECERLQGFLDGYTNIPWRKKPESPDGPRYKALGNSMAVPVMAWIGKRIQQVSEL
jgi:DNA (cytosine-5)-methyltransferase 1